MLLSYSFLQICVFISCTEVNTLVFFQSRAPSAETFTQNCSLQDCPTATASSRSGSTIALRKRDTVVMLASCHPSKSKRLPIQHKLKVVVEKKKKVFPGKVSLLRQVACLQILGINFQTDFSVVSMLYVASSRNSLLLTGPPHALQPHLPDNDTAASDLPLEAENRIKGIPCVCTQPELKNVA